MHEIRLCSPMIEMYEKYVHPDAYRKKYEKRKNNLMARAMKEGLLTLGGQLESFMGESGEKIPELPGLYGSIAIELAPTSAPRKLVPAYLKA
jgi:hypothetical protein